MSAVSVCSSGQPMCSGAKTAAATYFTGVNISGAHTVCSQPPGLMLDLSKPAKTTDVFNAVVTDETQMTALSSSAFSPLVVATFKTKLRGKFQRAQLANFLCTTSYLNRFLKVLGIRRIVTEKNRWTLMGLNVEMSTSGRALVVGTMYDPLVSLDLFGIDSRLRCVSDQIIAGHQGYALAQQSALADNGVHQFSSDLVAVNDSAACPHVRAENCDLCTGEPIPLTEELYYMMLAGEAQLVEEHDVSRQTTLDKAPIKPFAINCVSLGGGRVLTQICARVIFKDDDVRVQNLNQSVHFKNVFMVVVPGFEEGLSQLNRSMPLALTSGANADANIQTVYGYLDPVTAIDPGYLSKVSNAIANRFLYPSLNLTVQAMALGAKKSPIITIEEETEQPQAK